MTADLEQAKRMLREQMKTRLTAIAPADAAAWSAQVCARIVGSEIFRRAGVVMLFASLPGEVDLRPVAAQTRRVGKRFCLPRADWAAKRIVPAIVSDMDRDLIQRQYGIREPAPDAVAVPVSEVGLVLVPGLAFDLAGNRLGRGAGFFDRFLADPALTGATCAAGFDIQVINSVPANDRDIPIQWVATQSRLVATRPAGSDNP